MRSYDEAWEKTQEECRSMCEKRAECGAFAEYAAGEEQRLERTGLHARYVGARAPRPRGAQPLRAARTAPASHPLTP